MIRLSISDIFPLSKALSLHQSLFLTFSPGLEVIILEFILKLKIKHNDWLLALHFEFETVFKFYNLTSVCDKEHKGVICNMTSTCNSSQSTRPTGRVLWEELLVLSRFHS